MNEIFSIVVLTLRICFISTLISTIFAILLGFTLGLNDNKFIKYVKIITNAFTSLPPVIAGVVVYLIFSKNGVLGHLSWLYTEKVIIIAQVLIVTPIITANIFPAVESIRNSFETSLGLKISKVKMYFQLIKEVKISVISAIITGFGRAISEVGAVMIVGGNVRFKTRVLTSAIVLENNKGNYQMSIKLGIILMAISLTVSFLAMIIRGRNNDKIKKSYS